MNGLIIFWHLVFALVGFLIGILIGRRIERRSMPPVQPATDVDKPAVVASAPGSLRAGRSSAGKVWVEMNGKHVEDKTQLDPNLRQGLVSLVTDLRPWVDLEKVPTAAPAPVTTPAPAAVPVAPKPEKKETPAIPAMKSIIEQVNDVLQARLEATTLQDRGIQLIEGPSGSVIVQDGLHRYEGLEAVPDAEVTALIRASIAEWEKSAK